MQNVKQEFLERYQIAIYFAAVLFIVVATVIPALGPASGYALEVAPFYIVFALIAPLLGWTIARLMGLGASAGRAIAFSTGTRNSLVILPLALAVPGAIPVLPAIIVTQTLVELLASVAYMHLMPQLGARRGGDHTDRL